MKIDDDQISFCGSEFSPPRFHKQNSIDKRFPTLDKSDITLTEIKHIQQIGDFAINTWYPPLRLEKLEDIGRDVL